VPLVRRFAETVERECRVDSRDISILDSSIGSRIHQYAQRSFPVGDLCLSMSFVVDEVL
jgi:hypothetical protein